MKGRLPPPPEPLVPAAPAGEGDEPAPPAVVPEPPAGLSADWLVPSTEAPLLEHEPDPASVVEVVELVELDVELDAVVVVVDDVVVLPGVDDVVVVLDGGQAALDAPGPLPPAVVVVADPDVLDVDPGAEVDVVVAESPLVVVVALGAAVVVVTADVGVVPDGVEVVVVLPTVSWVKVMGTNALGCEKSWGFTPT